MDTRARLFAAGFGCLTVLACGDQAVTQGPGDAGDGGADAHAADAARDGGSDSAAPADAASDAGPDAYDSTAVPGTGYFRVAHVSPDASPFDICLSTPGDATDFSASAPLFAPISQSGVAFSQVTTFQAVDPGTYGVRFVAPGGGGCAQALQGLSDAMLTLPTEAYATVIVRGSVAAGGFGARVVTDDGITAANMLGDAGPGSLLRVLHEAASVGTLDLGTGTLADGDYLPMFTGLTYDTTPAAGGNVDANGYYFPTLIDDTTVSVHTGGQTQDLATWAQIVINYFDVATLFVVPPAAGGAVRAVLCTRDYAQPTTPGLLNPTCSLLTQ